MVVTCWSVKGGSGTTVVAACLAVVAARSVCRPTLLVDLAGDAAAALGVDPSPKAGVVEWLAGADTVRVPDVGSWTSLPVGAPATGGPGNDLEASTIEVDEHLGLVGRGVGSLDSIPDPAGELLAARLAADGRFVVVDAGTRPPGATGGVADRLIASADRSLLVIRPCYLALRHVTGSDRRIDGVVLVEEPGRALGADDVASVAGAPVVARVRVEAQVARIVDAGLLSSRVPRAVERPLAGLVEG